MSFIPYQIRTERLPVSKAGHVFKIGAKFYVVTKVKRNRQAVPYNAASTQTPGDPLTAQAPTGAPAYTPLHGAIDQKRIVHIHYLSFSTLVQCNMYWQDEPMLSSVAINPLDNVLAALTGPYEVDKWSYSIEIHMKINKAAGAQTLYFEIIEYTVALASGEAPKRYIELTPEGEAVLRGF